MPNHQFHIDHQREQHERDGHMPKLPYCPVCGQEHGSVVRHFSSTSNSLHTLHLDTGYWGDIIPDGCLGYSGVAISCSLGEAMSASVLQGALHNPASIQHIVNSIITRRWRICDFAYNTFRGMFSSRWFQDNRDAGEGEADRVADLVPGLDTVAPHGLCVVTMKDQLQQQQQHQHNLKTFPTCPSSTSTASARSAPQDVGIAKAGAPAQPPPRQADEVDGINAEVHLRLQSRRWKEGSSSSSSSSSSDTPHQ